MSCNGICIGIGHDSRGSYGFISRGHAPSPKDYAPAPYFANPNAMTALEFELTRHEHAPEHKISYSPGMNMREREGNYDAPKAKEKKYAILPSQSNTQPYKSHTFTQAAENMRYAALLIQGGLRDYSSESNLRLSMRHLASIINGTSEMTDAPEGFLRAYTTFGDMTDPRISENINERIGERDSEMSAGRTGRMMREENNPGTQDALRWQEMDPGRTAYQTRESYVLNVTGNRNDEMTPSNTATRAEIEKNRSLLEDLIAMERGALLN